MSQIPAHPVRDVADPVTGEETPHRPAGDREEVYYAGSPLLRGEAGQVMLWGFIGLALIAAPVLWSRFIPQHHLNIWVAIALAVIGIICLMVPLAQTKTIKYRISNYRIDFERGVLSKTIDTMELWHVEDIKFHQTFFDRIMGVGTIQVLSHDDTTPNLYLHSVPDARRLFETLKQRIIAVKRQGGVLKMDTGT